MAGLISCTCILSVIIVIPTLYMQLDMAHQNLRIRMANFKVSFNMIIEERNEQKCNHRHVYRNYYTSVLCDVVGSFECYLERCDTNAEK